jgi:hypothetical protein
LLHIDAFEVAKFDRPGHWATGERAERHRTRRAGTVKVIGVIDDHSRLAYSALLPQTTLPRCRKRLFQSAANDSFNVTLW